MSWSIHISGFVDETWICNELYVRQELYTMGRVTTSYETRVLDLDTGTVRVRQDWSLSSGNGHV